MFRIIGVLGVLGVLEVLGIPETLGFLRYKFSERCLGFVVEMDATTEAPEGPHADDAPTTTNDPDGTLTRRRFLQTAAVAGAATAASGSAAATETPTSTSWEAGRGGLDWSSAYVQNPYIEEAALVRARHRMAWGADDEALRAYEDDNGDKSMLPGYVPRDDTENVLTVRADKFDFPAATKFPRGETYDGDGDGTADEEVTALDATHWTGTNSTNGTVSISDADLDVSDALTVSSSSVPSGETVKAAFSDVSITDSPSKRFLQFVINVSTLESGATVEVAVIDDDGDEKVVSASPGADTTTASVFADATGDGYVLQQRLADLSTVANGDGAFDSIDSVEVRISDANATVTLTALDIEAKSRWLFGSYLANEGTDSEERVKRYEPGSGTFTVTGLDTLGDGLGHEDAVIHDVEQPFRYTLEASSYDYEYRFREATDYPGFSWLFDQRGKFEVPTAIELTHSGLTMYDMATVPANRYKEVWTASGIEDVAFDDLDDDTDKTYHGASYDSEGKEVTLISSATGATVYGYGASVLATDDDKSGAIDAPSGGGGAAPAEGSDNGGTVLMFGGITATIGAVIAKLRGWF